MTKRREWPNVAREARDRAAEEINDAINALEPLVMEPDKRFDRTETLRRQSKALNAMQKAIRFLESVGAQTRPR